MNVNAAVINGAHIDVSYQRMHFDEFQLRFWEALKTLTKSDCINLSRTIGASLDTILSWKYARNLQPRDAYHMFAVIRWVEDGKPTERISDSIIE